MAEHDLDWGVPQTLQARQRRARYITAAIARAEYKVLEDDTVRRNSRLPRRLG